MMRTFLKRGGYVAVATATQQPDGCWRLTTWRPDGPSGHQTFTADELERELRWHWTEWPGAALFLDSWSKTAKWERGLKQCQFIQAWNELAHLDFDAGCGQADELISGTVHDFGGGSDLEPFSCSFWRCER